MKPRRCLTLVLISTALACSHTAHLYPVEGPLSAQTPPPVLTAKFTGVFTPGDFSATLGDGEICKGHFAVVPRDPNPKAGSPGARADEDLRSAWDAVYGSGFYVSHVLGARLHGRVVASGDRGTVLTIELYKPEIIDNKVNTALPKGVAQDNKGNTFKVVL